MPGLGAPRVLPVARPDASALPMWLVAADAPAGRFSEGALNRNLSNIDWVTRAALGHESVVEACLKCDAVLPMKLFTIFATEERALAEFAGGGDHVLQLLERVRMRDEWSVRVALSPAASDPAVRPPGHVARPPQRGIGAAYLAAKKAQRDARSERAERARHVVSDLYKALAAQADRATRRSPAETPLEDGPLLLDAAFLVRRPGAKFRSALARRARSLQPKGYRVSLSGPWPPYSFLEDA